MVAASSGQHGVARAMTLRAAGLTAQDLRRMVEVGTLHRLRAGWYATDQADPAVVRAIRLGGRLSCASALGLHGLWQPPGRTLHLRLPDRARRGQQRLPPGVRRCRAVGPDALLAGPDPVDPLPLALTAAGRCLPAEQFVAVLDSARHRLGLHPHDLAAMLSGCPQRVQELVDRTAPAESGTESLVRFRLTSLGITVVPQVTIGGVGRVDLLVGQRLVIEVDSIAHHTDPATYHSDRVRDRALIALGYLPVRLTYHQVMHAWEPALADLLTLIRRRDHLRWPPNVHPGGTRSPRHR